MVSVSGPEVAFKPDVLAAHTGVGAFPDGPVAYRWPPLVGRPHPIFYGSAGGVMARYDQPAGVAQVCKPAHGLPSYYRYAAGGGGVLTNYLDGSWLGCVHLERAAPSSPNLFWGNLGWLVSRDYGQKSESVSACWIVRATAPLSVGWAIIPICGDQDEGTPPDRNKLM